MQCHERIQTLKLVHQKGIKKLISAQIHIYSKSLHFCNKVKWGWMQCDDRIQIPKQVGPIVWNALSSAKSGFILRYSRYHQQQPATLRLTAQHSIKTSQECETALTSQYETLFLVFVFLSFCIFVFLSSLWLYVWRVSSFKSHSLSIF